MNLSILENKKIGILGLGIENYALVKFLLEKKVNCNITICDQRNEKELGEKFEFLSRRINIAWKLGKSYNKNLHGFDILFRSPGWPMFCPGIKVAVKLGVELSSPMKLFFDLCPTENIIGITGTKGKGTTSSLIAKILKSGRKKVWLGGNIGIAPFDFIEKVKKNHWIVLEMSSFQLEDMTKSPYIGVITNIYSEHLAPADPNNPNYHRSLHGYVQSKLNIIRFQKKGDRTVVNKKISKYITPIRRLKLHSKIIKFGKVNIESKLVGEHNKENIAAALEVAKIVGIDENRAIEAIKKFKGLEHRIEFAGERNGVKFFDDSFATIPEVSIIAIRSFHSPIILLAGGAEKNSDFKELAKTIKRKVKYVVLFQGDATPRLKKELLNAGYKENKIRVVENMSVAVKAAKEKAEKGDIILLSPACASFGMFRNYKERGNLFKKEV